MSRWPWRGQIPRKEESYAKLWKMYDVRTLPNFQKLRTNYGTIAKTDVGQEEPPIEIKEEFIADEYSANSANRDSMQTDINPDRHQDQPESKIVKRAAKSDRQTQNVQRGKMGKPDLMPSSSAFSQSKEDIAARVRYWSTHFSESKATQCLEK